MEIKYSTQGLLIYIAFGLYILAFLGALFRAKKISHILFFAGFCAAICSFCYRWYIVKHLPGQNLFEVFVFLGMIVYPLSLFSVKILRTRLFGFDMLIGAIVLFPAGFVFSERPLNLPPALQSPLFAPHVAFYLLAYIFMTKAAAHAFLQLISKAHTTSANPKEQELATHNLVCVGFPLLTAGLILGSIWARFAWGDYWGWDPKEMWSLAGWLVYVTYFHFRYSYGDKYPKINSVLAIVGFAVIIITLVWVNLSTIFAGLHSYA